MAEDIALLQLPSCHQQYKHLSILHCNAVPLPHIINSALQRAVMHMVSML